MKYNLRKIIAKGCIRYKNLDDFIKNVKITFRLITYLFIPRQQQQLNHFARKATV